MNDTEAWIRIFEATRIYMGTKSTIDETNIAFDAMKEKLKNIDAENET